MSNLSSDAMLLWVGMGWGGFCFLTIDLEVRGIARLVVISLDLDIQFLPTPSLIVIVFDNMIVFNKDYIY